VASNRQTAAQPAMQLLDMPEALRVIIVQDPPDPSSTT
jgi:hypothetical protein